MNKTGKISSGHTLPVIALSLLTGVCVLQLQPDLSGPVWTRPELVLFLPVCLWLFYLLPRNRTLIALFTGYLWALLFAQFYLLHQLPPSLTGQDILLEGVVAGLPDYNGQSVRFDFQVKRYITIPVEVEKVQVENDRHQMLDKRMPARLRLSWYYFKGEIHNGEHWQLKVRLKQPHGMHNPGGFDYEKWLYRQGIHATGYIRKSADNQRLQISDFTIESIREKLLSVLSKLPDPSYQGLLQALTIGQKSAINTQQWQVLRQTGTSHLMAISGLHIGLVAGLVFLLVRRFVPAFLCKYSSSPQVAAIVSLFVAGAYAMLAGFSVPTQRAFIMLLVFMFAILIKRPAFSENTLSLALIAVIVANPGSVLSAGFWLSFLAVMIIALISSARVRAQQTRLKLWLQGVRIQWLIALGMLPLSALLFQQGSLISPLANMIVIPLVGMMIVPLALLASFVSLLSTDSGIWLFTLTSELLSYVWFLLEWFAQLPFSSWQHSSVPLLQSVLALTGVTLLLMPKGFPLRYSGLILLLPMLLYKSPKPEQGAYWVDVIDVGQGLSVLVQTADHALLYDSGAKFSEKFDIGQRVVVPYLNYKGLNQLDMLMISHADNDHAGGAGAVLQMIEVKDSIAEAQMIKQNDRSLNIKSACEAGHSWQWDGVNFEIIHPDKEYRKSNNRSCVLKVFNENVSLLLTGDIEKKVELNLLKNQPDNLNVDVLVVPHHGSNTSSSRAWLNRLKPQLAIVSAGFNNRFGHPTVRVMERYHHMGSRLLNTASSGMIQLKMPASSARGILEPELHRKVSKHYWNHRF